MAFLDLEGAQARTRAIDLDWSQLQLEQSTLSKSERIEEIAIRDLHMSTITANRTQYLGLPNSAAPSTSPLKK
jgi:cell division protein FtsL